MTVIQLIDLRTWRCAHMLFLSPSVLRFKGVRCSSPTAGPLSLIKGWCSRYRTWSTNEWIKRLLAEICYLFGLGASQPGWITILVLSPPGMRAHSDSNKVRGGQNFFGGITFSGSLATKLRIVTEPSLLVPKLFVCNVQLAAEVVKG